MLYKQVELKEGVPIQYLGVYALRWRPEWGEPTVGFTEADVDGDIERAIALFGRILDFWHDHHEEAVIDDPRYDQLCDEIEAWLTLSSLA